MSTASSDFVFLIEHSVFLGSEPLTIAGPEPIRRLDPLRKLYFEQIDFSVYQGDQLIGRYSRIGVGRIAAVDACGLWLGDYRSQGQARSAIYNRSQRLLNAERVR
jgi:hypothetical protein